MARHTRGATVGKEADGPSGSHDSPAGSPRPQPVPARVLARTRLALPPDWLPLALLVGDAIIAALSVPFAYWIRYGKADQALPFGPYLAAIPVVAVLYLFSLAVNHQHTSARRKKLADQRLSLHRGIGRRAILILAPNGLANPEQPYST